MFWLAKYFNLHVIEIIAFVSYCAIANTELNFNNDFENNKSFKSVPTTIKTFENDTVLLPCYHNSSFRYVRWHRDDILLIDSRHPETPSNNRIHLWLNGSLQVTNVQAEDTGDYYCEMMAHTGHVVQVHAIEVQYSPTVIIEPSGTIELAVGAIFEILCEAKGVPQPAITLHHNNKIVDKNHIGNRQNFYIEVKSRKMSGYFECVANNGVGEPTKAGVYVNVLYTPELKTSQNVVYTKINARTQLECIVVASPLAIVKWLHHGMNVIFDKRLSRYDIELQSSSQNCTEIKHILVIEKVRDSDFGFYECRAENKIGYNNVNIELTGRPMACVFKINSGVQSSTSHILVWQTESSSPIMEYKLKFRQIPSGNISAQYQILKTEWTLLTIPSELSVGSVHTITYTLRGLQPASVYEVIAQARNHYGWSENSKVIRFATGGEVELPNYSTESEIHYKDTEEGLSEELLPDINYVDSIKSMSTSFVLNRFMMSLIVLMTIRF